MGARVRAENSPKLKSPAKFSSKTAEGILTKAMSPPNLKEWLPATTLRLSVHSYRVSVRTTGEKSSRPMNAVPVMLKATASLFCEVKVARRSPKLNLASFTLLPPNVEVKLATTVESISLRNAGTRKIVLAQRLVLRFHLNSRNATGVIAAAKSE